MEFPGRPFGLGFEPIRVVAMFGTFNVFRLIRATRITEY